MLSALTLAAALIAAPTDSRTVELRAEQVLHDGAQRRTTAEGSARLRTAGSALSADRIVYDEGQHTVTATGDVALRLWTFGLIAVTAEAVSLRLEDDEVVEVFIYQGLAVRKKGTTAEALAAAQTRSELAAAGSVAMTLTGSHLERDGSAWVADDIVFVPCDCDFENPTWGIHAARARADFAAERVSLLSPTVRVKGVPVLWVPWLSLPLTARQTGLLVPKPTYSALNGFALEEPVFVTLGQSADLTLTPGYYFGVSGTDYGVSGPRLLTELRYAPSWTTSGRLTLGLLYDLRARRDPIAPALKTQDPRGLRGEATVQHHQALDGRWHFNVDGQLLSDGYYLRDVTADVLAREAFYLRSTAAVFRRSEDTWLGLDAVLRQDVSWGYSLFQRDPVLAAGIPARGPNPFHRLPGLTFALAERPLWGPLSWGMRAELVRLAPLSGNSGDEGPAANEGRATATVGGEEVTLPTECVQQRLYWPTAPNLAQCPAFADERAFEADRTWQPGERQSRDRLDLFPHLSARASLAEVVSLSATAAWRQNVWLGEVDGSAAWRGYPLLSARADSELARSFAVADGALRHVIAASAEVRGAPVILGAAPVAYDELDAAWPDATPRLQAVAELRQRLLSRQGQAVRELLRFDLGQGAELLGPDRARLAESWVRVSGRAGWLTGDVAVRLDLPRGRVTRVSATAALDDGAGRGLYAGWENLLDDGTDRTRQPIDLLFGPRAGPGNLRAQALNFGGRVRLGGFSARYDALLLERRYVVGEPLGGAAPPSVEALTFAQHTLGVGYGPRCDCWRLEVYATQRSQEAPGQKGPPSYLVPDFGATLTLTGFGAFGTGG